MDIDNRGTQFRLLTTKQVSEMTGIPVRTLEGWRTADFRKRRPTLPFRRLPGGGVRYLFEGVKAFFDAGLVY